MSAGDFTKLERVFGLHFNDPALCREAFTHKSFAAEHNLKYDNQRLELLGDAVVQILMTEELYKRYADLQEGMLTRIRSALVNQDSLSAFARSIGLGDYLLLGRGEIELNGADRDSTLCDTFEAFVGAIYLDQGLDAARTFFLNILNRQIPDPRSVLNGQNPKGALQEFTQQRGMGIPSYRVLSVSGPDHMPVYTVEVRLGKHDPENATASSRKHAECSAAEKLLERLKREEAEENQKQQEENPPS